MNFRKMIWVSNDGKNIVSIKFLKQSMRIMELKKSITMRTDSFSIFHIGEKSLEKVNLWRISGTLG